jgi:hypothetical protein
MLERIVEGGTPPTSRRITEVNTERMYFTAETSSRLKTITTDNAQGNTISPTMSIYSGNGGEVRMICSRRDLKEAG